MLAERHTYRARACYEESTFKAGFNNHSKLKAFNKEINNKHVFDILFFLSWVSEIIMNNMQCNLPW